MKKCPFCAEDIQDQAIKCKHCNEILDESSTSVPQAMAPSPKKSRSVLAIICALVFSAPLFWSAQIAFSEGNTGGGIGRAAYAAAFIVVALIAWRIGDVFRKFAQPDAVFASGAVEMAGKKLFWIVGPQVVAVWLAFLGAVVLAGSTVGFGFSSNKPAEIAKAEPESPKAQDGTATVQAQEVESKAETPQEPKVELVSHNSATEPVEKSQQPAQEAAAKQEVTEPAASQKVSEAPASWAPSFNCAKAGSNIEKLICGNKELSDADVKLMQVYKLALQSSADKDGLNRKQNEWRKSERDVCNDVQCTLEAYNRRIAQLAN